MIYKMKYKQVSEPNPELLKDLITKIKGDDNMGLFADKIKKNSPETNVSASTISRACNCNGKPVSIQLLEAIAAVAEGDKEEVLKELAEANGMQPIDEATKQYDKALRERRRFEAMRAIEDGCMEGIENAILVRGYQAQRLSKLKSGRTLNSYIGTEDTVFYRNYSFGFNVSGMHPCHVWKFMLNPLEIPNGSSDKSIEANVTLFFNRVASVFAGDQFEPYKYEQEKYSFVFLDRILYEKFISRLTDNDISVNGLMTVILMSNKENKYIVEEEKQIKREDGEIAAAFFSGSSNIEKDYDVEDENIDMFYFESEDDENDNL